MFIQIDPDRPLPLFSQIMEGVRLAIATNRLLPGHRIPSIRDLAIELRVNPNTVARAYMELERTGIIETRRGLGYFVSAELNGRTVEHEREQLLQVRIDEFLTQALELGFGPEHIKAAIDRRLKKS